MQKVIIQSACTISGMMECGYEISRFVKHQNVRVLSQENGHWELEIAPQLIAELIAMLMNLDQIPENIHITSVLNGVL